MSRRIQRMRVENFLSFGEAEFDFEKVGFVLVEGENGSGKSAIVDAILWCLFGETLRGYKHDEVINRKVGEGCLVAVDFVDDGDGSAYRVGRARRHPKMKNSLWLSCDGADVSVAGEKETQSLVDQALGCSFKTFVSSVVFGQDRAYRFSSLTDAEQKKILDEVLGVERFAAACAAARKQVSATQAELETAERDLDRAEKARDEAETEVVDLQVKDADFAATQTRKVEAERETLAKAKEWLGKTRRFRDLEKLKEAAENADREVVACERKVVRASEADLAARSSRSVAASRRDELTARLEDASAESCPTCGQRLDARKRAGAVGKLKGELAKLEELLAVSERSCAAAEAALNLARDKLKEARAATSAARAAYSQGLGVAADSAAWRRRAKDCEARIAELGREASPYAELAAKARARHARHEKEAGRLAETVGELEERLTREQFWVKAFGNAGLRSLLIDSSLPLLNEEASRVSRVLTGGSIAIEFSATSEQKSGKVVDRFEVRVDNRNGAGDYAGNSAGERAKVDLCVGLALQRLVASRSSASFNLAVFDEVFDHLDSASHEPVVEVLSVLDKESVLVVSHDDDLKGWFPATWRMTKRGGFSTVET